MITLKYLVVALSALTTSFAAPVAELVAVFGERSPDFDLQDLTPLVRRQNYNQDYTTGGGTVNYSPKSNGYSVTFSRASDFVVGKGWTKGSAQYCSIMVYYALN